MISSGIVGARWFVKLQKLSKITNTTSSIPNRCPDLVVARLTGVEAVVVFVVLIAVVIVSP